MGSLSDFISGGAALTRATKTANYTVVSGDNSKLIEATSGTWTLSLTAAATLGDGHFFYFKNSGSGDITLDPSGSETIDGLTSFIMYPGESRLITCDGSGFYSTVLTPFYKTFTSSGTFTKPPGYSLLGGLLWGAGGGGSDDGGSTDAGGGGGGACLPFLLPPSDLDATESVTIGAGGAGGAGLTAASSPGGNSTLSLASGALTSYGGGGSSSAQGAGGGGVLSGSGTSLDGGKPTSSVANDGDVDDNPGFGGAQNASQATGGASAYGGAAGGKGNNAGGASLYGGGGGGGATDSAGASGGVSVFGGNGGDGTSSGGGNNGAAPAGGGGAAGGNAVGGEGARGELRIWGHV